MSHWAELDDDNIVLRVLVGTSDPDSGALEWLDQNVGGRWLQTSYNATIRKNFAGMGYSYDLARDAFIPPRPYTSWTLDDVSCRWEPPTPRPDGDYIWDENTTQWEESE
jgi:hypothetical protein